MTPDSREAPVTTLTAKERECLRLVLENWSSKEIARQLGISHTSVDTHVRRARAKLGVRDRHEAAVLLDRWEREAAGGAAPAAGTAATLPTPAAPRGLLPPLETFGPLARLGLILLAALVLASAFALGAIVLQHL